MDLNSQKIDEYPNIKALNDLFIKHKVSVKVSDKFFMAGRKDFPLVVLAIGKQSFKLFVEDDYEDFKYNYPILNFCIVLRELEDFKFSNDYLLWCVECHLNASDLKIKNYYKDLDRIYNKIKAVLGKIKSFIPDRDFEFEMGEVKALREKNGR